jgi:tetratricopeptide (TPR) repeat protein
MLLSRFREQLQSSEWAERERVPRTAGLAILQAIAVRVDSEVAPDASDIDMARAVVDTLPHGATSRALGELLRVIDADPPSPAGPALMAYGKALQDDGAYELAADVYQLAAELGRREQALKLAPAALVRVGACLRSLGRHKEAIRAYRAAAAVAQEIGDRVEELMAHTGLAKVAIAQDRYPAARKELSRVIDAARKEDLRYPLGLALHDRGSLGNREGDLESALLDLSESLSLERDSGEQIRVLSDIGWTLRELGVLEFARDVFACVRAETAEVDLRCSATINLLAVSIDLAQWNEFDHWRDVLETAALSPYRHCEFLVTLALGLTTRGADAEARATYQTLRDFGRRYELNEFERLAQDALDGHDLSRATQQPALPLPLRCRPALDVIRERVPVRLV